VSEDSPKKLLFAQFAQVAKALSHGYRLEMLEFLAQGERGVDKLAKLTGISIANASQHLQKMERAGLVSSRRDGHYNMYRISDEAVLGVLAGLRMVAENNLAEVDKIVSQYFLSKDSFQPVSSEQLLEISRKGLVTVLDVRPTDEYASGHVQNAVNIPLGELADRLGELPKGQEVVAYCRGPYCVLSFDAVAYLRGQGYQARRLDEGLPEWKAAGRPVDTIPAT
jgi:ArsR family transcriptional regulator